MIFPESLVGKKIITFMITGKDTNSISVACKCAKLQYEYNNISPDGSVG